MRIGYLRCWSRTWTYNDNRMVGTYIAFAKGMNRRFQNNIALAVL